MSIPTGASDPKAPIPVWAWVVSAVVVVAIVGGGIWWFTTGQKIAVPDVAGENQTAATQALQVAGLQLGQVSNEATKAPVGSIVAQSPAAGAKVAKGSAVNLTISSGPSKVEVPKLKGMTRDEAEKALSKAGLKSVQTAEYDSYVAKESVIDQLPAAGDKVAPGSTVGVLLSLGARPIPPVAVPDVKGKTQAQARKILSDAGLNSDFVTANDNAPAGTVAGQTPASGVKVAPDTEILVLVSAGVAPPTAVAVPNVVGKQSGTAQNALGQAGLRGRTYGTYSARPKGEVIAQEPVSGARVATGTVVGMLISAGPAPTNPPANPPTYPQPPADTPKPPSPPIVETVQVPDVVGLSEEEATAALTDKGLEAIVIPYESAETPKGKVVTQLPKAGEYVPKGYSVLLMVSTGPTSDAAEEAPAEKP